MIDIVDQDVCGLPRNLADALVALNSATDQTWYRLLKIDRSAASREAQRDLRHDVAGALRTYRYLADQFFRHAPPGDPRAASKRQAIDQHFETLTKLQTLLNQLMPPEES